MSEHSVIVALGSNWRQETMIETAKQCLDSLFGGRCTYSRSMWTEPVSIESDMFLNCLCFARTKLDACNLVTRLKEIERQCGTTSSQRERNIVSIDLDLLRHDNLIMHKRDWSRDYIRELVKDCPF